MRKAWLLAALVLCLGPSQAHARLLSLTLEGSVGPYVPDLDPYHGANALDTTAGVTGFNCEFGFGVRPMVRVSPQLTVFDLFGTVTVGGEVGFYNIKTRKLFSVTDCTSGTGLTSEELTVMPAMATVTYRFDWALDRYRVPIVPYARLGVGGAGWLITNNGKPADSKPVPVTDEQGNPVLNSDGQPTYSQRNPLGFSLGGKLALGMMVALDFLEPLRALQARAKGIYSHTFVFVEVAGFTAGQYENVAINYLSPRVQPAGRPFSSYLGNTLNVGMERLPMVTAGLVLVF